MPFTRSVQLSSPRDSNCLAASLLLAAAIPLLGCQELTAQSWTQLQTAGAQPIERIVAGTVFDSARGKLVLFGGGSNGGYLNDTWEWDSVGTPAWTQKTTANQPSIRGQMGCAYDPVRDRTVVFAGYDGTFLGDTWEYNGSDWTLVNNQGPSNRCGSVMVFDAARGKIMLFGGQQVGGLFPNDTWEWDGTTWTQLDPGGGSAPPGRYGHALAYDPVLGRIVMFGGWLSTNLGNTWAWNGTSWSLVTTNGPPARDQHSMAFDHCTNSVVVYGGKGANYTPVNEWDLEDTWSLTGSTWSEITISGPPRRREHRMVSDLAGGRILMFAGRQGGLGGAAQTLYNELWAFDGGSCTSPPGPTADVVATLVATTPRPPPVRNHALTSLPSGGALLFGGETASGPHFPTYELQGTAWVKQFSFNNPMVRTGHVLLADDARQNTVMFGGENPLGTKLDDTWLYVSGQWSAVFPAIVPSPRSQHSMAYDAISDIGLLFGGEDGAGSTLGDFWSWNGNDWSLLTPAVSPPARKGHGMAWDKLRNVLVLFGGTDGSARLNDVWEWDGTNWTQITPAQHSGVVYQPTPRDGFAMAYDPDAERIVVIGGETDLSCVNEVWTWGGTEWIAHIPVGGGLPFPRKGAQLYVDSNATELRMYGGGCGAIYSDELWEFQLPVFSRYESYGQGCIGSNGMPTLSVDPTTSPIIGTTMNLIYDNVPGTFIPAVGAFGYSRTTYLGLPLPIDLSVANLPGCWLLHSADVQTAIAPPNGTGTVTWPIALPNISWLLGGEIHFQCLHLELPGFSRWAAMSNAVTVRLGNR